MKSSKVRARVFNCVNCNNFYKIDGFVEENVDIDSNRIESCSNCNPFYNKDTFNSSYNPFLMSTFGSRTKKSEELKIKRKNKEKKSN